MYAITGITGNVSTPVGMLSVFAYKTPVPFPFGQERTGYLVANMDDAIKAARAAGAGVIVEPFRDPIGMDSVIQWNGGVKMQLYWSFSAPSEPHCQPYRIIVSIFHVIRTDL